MTDVPYPPFPRIYLKDYVNCMKLVHSFVTIYRVSCSEVFAMAAASTQETRTDRLVKWAVDLKYSDIPDHVVQHTKDFFLDTLGCTIAGRSHPAVSAMVRFATQMGPSSGKSELVDGSQSLTTSPAFASLINAAASHVVEQDDLHNRSIMHPVSAANARMISPYEHSKLI